MAWRVIIGTVLLSTPVSSQRTAVVGPADRTRGQIPGTELATIKRVVRGHEVHRPVISDDRCRGWSAVAVVSVGVVGDVTDRVHVPSVIMVSPPVGFTREPQ